MFLMAEDSDSQIHHSLSFKSSSGKDLLGFEELLKLFESLAIVLGIRSSRSSTLQSGLGKKE